MTEIMDYRVKWRKYWGWIVKIWSKLLMMLRELWFWWRN